MHVIVPYYMWMLRTVPLRTRDNCMYNIHCKLHIMKYNFEPLTEVYTVYGARCVLSREHEWMLQQI